MPEGTELTLVQSKVPADQADEYDAHPNEIADQTVGPLFVSFVDRAVETYVATSTE